MIKRWRYSQAAISESTHLHNLEPVNRNSLGTFRDLRLITAMKTPYTPNGRPDIKAFDSLIRMQISHGVQGIVVGGLTGEGHLMKWDEHMMLISHAANCFGHSVSVIGDISRISTREAIYAAEQGFLVGMDAAIHVNPYYGKTSIEGLVQHFENVMSIGPTIIHNVPSRTGQDIPFPVVKEISKNRNLVGIMECAGNDRIKCYADGGLVVWSGNDDDCHEGRWRCNARGLISAVSNLIPGLMHELIMVDHKEKGIRKSGLNSKMMCLVELLFCEANPIGVNTALAQLGVVRPVFKLPYVPLPLERRKEFVNLVQSIGRENFVGEGDLQVLEDDDFVVLDRY